jgi:anti-anti-sigma factor
MSNIDERSRTDTYALPLARSCSVAIDHSGISLRSHFQPDITLVEVHGTVDARNADWLSNYVDTLASGHPPVVLDLRGVDSPGGEGFPGLAGIAEKCRRTAARWALATSKAVDRLLRITHINYRLPITDSLEARQLTRPDSATQLLLPVTSRRVKTMPSHYV